MAVSFFANVRFPSTFWVFLSTSYYINAITIKLFPRPPSPSEPRQAPTPESQNPSS